MDKSQLKIVLVDDSCLCLEVLQEHLLDEGYLRIQVFSNPLEARVYLMEHDVDVLITDYEMPGLNGIQLIDAASSVPLKIMMSGALESIADLRCECMRKDTIPIDKPFKPEALSNLLLSSS